MKTTPSNTGVPSAQADSARIVVSWKETHETYLQSDHWKDLRLRCLNKAKFQCEACESKHDLQGHHLLYRTPLESCTENDVMVLCTPCHERWHKWIQSEGFKLKDFTRATTKAKLRQFNEVKPCVLGFSTKGMHPDHVRFYEEAYRTAPKSGPIQMHNYAIKKTERRFGIKLKHLKQSHVKKGKVKQSKSASIPNCGVNVNSISRAQTLGVLERVVFEQAKTIMELRIRLEALESKVSSFAPY